MTTAIVSNGAATHPLVRAVVISLFTWRRAEPDDSVDDSELQGWWGDSLPTVAGDRIGSRLWLLRRAKMTPDTLRRAEAYAREALAWLTADGMAESVDVSVARTGELSVALTIDLSDLAGDPLSLEFSDLWQVIRDV